MLSTSYQEANNQPGYKSGDQRSAFVSTNLSYSYSIIPTSIVLTVTANVYSTHAANIKTTFYGPTVNISKSFFQKALRGSLSSSYNKTVGYNVSGEVLNNRFNLTFTPRDKQGGRSNNNFTFGLIVLRRMQDTENQPSFTELTSNLNYSHSF